MTRSQRISATQFLRMLRESGLGMDYDTFKQAAGRGVFGDAVHIIPKKRCVYLIFRPAAERWIAEHSEPVEADPELLAYGVIYQQEHNAETA